MREIVGMNAHAEISVILIRGGSFRRIQTPRLDRVTRIPRRHSTGCNDSSSVSCVSTNRAPLSRTMCANRCAG